MYREVRVLPRPAFGLLGLVILLLAAKSVPAQTSSLPRFDVFSIKPNVSDVDGGMSEGMQGDTFQAKNVTMRFLLAAVFGVRQELVQGLPKWAESTHWNIQAKISDADSATLNKLTSKQRDVMQQQLLLDNLKLQLHRETRVRSGLELTVVPNGVKMKSHPLDPNETDPDGSGSLSYGNGQMQGTEAPVSVIVSCLADILDQVVIDDTGLTGFWDLKLRWAPEGDQQSREASLYTALQEQLGLRLSSGKGPVEFLVVDHLDDPREAKDP